MILEGKVYPLIQGLLKQMDNYARELDFENAAKIRDKINALSVLSESREGLNSDDELDDLKKLLGLKELPVIIEAFDISNISGRQATGSMVSFSKGRPDKKNYRRFRIKSVHGVDDYAMLSEVVSRRYLRLVKNKLPMPNLILIDGGKAHLIAAQKEIKKLSLDIPLVSIAKEEENIYIPSRRLPIKLNSDTPALNLIRRIRDEAHRFALSYHRLLRRKEVLGR
jgi:excinuclease ABC subunit C